MKRNAFFSILSIIFLFPFICSFTNIPKHLSLSGAIDYVYVVSEPRKNTYVGSGNAMTNRYIKNNHSTKSINVKYQIYYQDGMSTKLISTKTILVNSQDSELVGTDNDASQLGGITGRGPITDVRILAASYAE